MKQGNIDDFGEQNSNEKKDEFGRKQSKDNETITRESCAHDFSLVEVSVVGVGIPNNNSKDQHAKVFTYQIDENGECEKISESTIE